MDHQYGTVQFVTSVEVTGELTPRERAIASCRLICMYAVTRLNEIGLQKASESLIDIYQWQQAQLNTPAPTSTVQQLPGPPKVTRRSHVPFSIEET